MWVGDESPVRALEVVVEAARTLSRYVTAVEWQKSKSDTRRAPMKWSRLARLCRAFSIPKSQYWFPMRYDIPSPFFHFLLLNNYKILPGRFNIHAVEVERGKRRTLERASMRLWSEQLEWGVCRRQPQYFFHYPEKGKERHLLNRSQFRPLFICVYLSHILAESVGDVFQPLLWASEKIF